LPGAVGGGGRRLRGALAQSIAGEAWAAYNVPCGFS
jgi:hypothetical protein